MKDEEKHTDDIEFVEADEAGAEKSAQEKLSKLKEKISQLESEKKEYLDGWQRARADYANLQKATDEDKKRFKTHFAERFIEDLIPVVDSFLMAMGNKEQWEKVDASWRTGIEYIYSQLMNVLASHDLKLFGEVGEKFDPAKHEAVGEEAVDEKSKDHTIAKVAQKGFMLGEHLIRPARVSVYTAQ